MSSDWINSLPFFPKKNFKPLVFIQSCDFFLENDSRTVRPIVLSDLRQLGSHFIDRYYIILFFTIPIRRTFPIRSWWPPMWPGSLKITYFPRLSWSSLEFPRTYSLFNFALHFRPILFIQNGTGSGLSRGKYRNYGEISRSRSRLLELRDQHRFFRAERIYPWVNMFGINFFLNRSNHADYTACFHL